MTTSEYPNATIVVGVDGTRSSEAALVWAVAHGAATGQPVRAVMVATSPTVPANALDGFALFVPEPDPFDVSVILEATIERVVSDPIDRAGIERRVLVGGVADQLLAQADGASMLVLGQSSSALGRRFLGIARHLVGRAPCPVVVVPAAAPEMTRIDLPSGNNQHIAIAS